MNLNELRKMVKEVLQENAYDDFLKKQRTAKPTKMLPSLSRRTAKDAGVPEQKYNPETDNRIDATSDEDARAILKDRVKASGPAPGKQYVAKDAEGYFIRTLVDTRGT
tara:strand:- start:34 stop:357 length:324 start_codon:yes stop_codon:yes gene_type:complete